MHWPMPSSSRHLEIRTASWSKRQWPAGLPVISTTSAGDIRDRISEGITGYLVPPADPASLADRMRSIANDRELRVTMSQNAVAHAARFTDSRFAQDFETFVFEIIDLSPRRSPCSLLRFAGRTMLSLVPVKEPCGIPRPWSPFPHPNRWERRVRSAEEHDRPRLVTAQVLPRVDTLQRPRRAAHVRVFVYPWMDSTPTSAFSAAPWTRR